MNEGKTRVILTFDAFTRRAPARRLTSSPCEARQENNSNTKGTTMDEDFREDTLPVLKDTPYSCQDCLNRGIMTIECPDGQVKLITQCMAGGRPIGKGAIHPEQRFGNLHWRLSSAEWNIRHEGGDCPRKAPPV